MMLHFSHSFNKARKSDNWTCCSYAPFSMSEVQNSSSLYSTRKRIQVWRTGQFRDSIRSSLQEVSLPNVKDRCFVCCVGINDIFINKFAFFLTVQTWNPLQFYAPPPPICYLGQKANWKGGRDPTNQTVVTCLATLFESWTAVPALLKVIRNVKDLRFV